MAASQLSFRINPVQRKTIAHNARLRGVKPADYVRSLIDREEGGGITGAEWDRYLTRLLRRKKGAGK